MNEIIRALGLKNYGVYDGDTLVIPVPDDKKYAEVCQKLYSSDDFDLDDETFKISAEEQVASYVYKDEQYLVTIKANYIDNKYALSIKPMEE